MTCLELNDFINGEEVTTDKLLELIIKMMEIVKSENCSLFDEVLLETYKSINGDKITLNLAKKIVSNMKPIGEKWTYEQLVPLNKGYDKVNFYLVMNMFYNDYRHIIGNDTNTYVKFTEAWFDDIDGKENKTFDYFMK